MTTKELIESLSIVYLNIIGHVYNAAVIFQVRTCSDSDVQRLGSDIKIHSCRRMPQDKISKRTYVSRTVSFLAHPCILLHC